MKLTNEDIKQYAMLWMEEFREVLTPEQACLEANRTMELFTLLAGINKDWKDPKTGEGLSRSRKVV